MIEKIDKNHTNFQCSRNNDGLLADKTNELIDWANELTAHGVFEQLGLSQPTEELEPTTIDRETILKLIDKFDYELNYGMGKRISPQDDWQRGYSACAASVIRLLKEALTTREDK